MALTGSVTTTAPRTLQQVMDAADPNELADALRDMALGTMLSPLKVTFASLTSAAAQNITTAAAFAAATIATGNQQGALAGALPAPTTLPPILAVTALRITAGTAHQQPCVVTDSGGTAQDNSSGVSVATLSDDGKTLTFGAAVTGFVLEYIPRPASDMSAAFLHS